MAWAMVKIVSPISQREVDAVNVDFEPKSEPWATYELSDGSVVKVRSTVTGVVRLEGEHDGAGNPLYNISSQVQIRVVSAPKDLRGAPTFSGGPPGRMAVSGGPEVR